MILDNSICKYNEEVQITAVKKVINNMGVKYEINLEKIADNIYEFVSKQGKIKRFIVFSTFNLYDKWVKDNKEKEKKMFKSWTQYVVQLI